MPIVKRENGKFPAYAWPGGYPIYYLDRENNVLCPSCANKEKAKAMVGDVNYEDDSLYCDECSKQIESAYGDTEAESNPKRRTVRKNPEKGITVQWLKAEANRLGILLQTSSPGDGKTRYHFYRTSGGSIQSHLYTALGKNDAVTYLAGYRNCVQHVEGTNPRKRNPIIGAHRRLAKEGCQCADRGCPVHPNQSWCDNDSTTVLHRVDMDDRTGTRMCNQCAQDAMESGLFRENPVPVVTEKSMIGGFPQFIAYARKTEGSEFVRVAVNQSSNVKAIRDASAHAKRYYEVLLYLKFSRQPEQHLIAHFIDGKNYLANPQSTDVQLQRYAKRRKFTGSGGDPTLIYGKIEEIRAQKTQPHKCDDGCKRVGHRYRHTFKSNSQIYGLPSGDIMISNHKRR